MKNRPVKTWRQSPAGESIGEVLILPDGRIFAHNISPRLAGALAALNPADESMRRRAYQKKQAKHGLSN
jgi:hypothetical protein